MAVTGCCARLRADDSLNPFAALTLLPNTPCLIARCFAIVAQACRRAGLRVP